MKIINGKEVKMTQATLTKRKAKSFKLAKKPQKTISCIVPKYIHTKNKNIPILQYQKSGYEKLLKYLIK
jgi:hypothetical protein